MTTFWPARGGAVEFDQAAEAVFGQASFTANLCNRSVSPTTPSADTLCSPAGTTLDVDGNLYVADGYGLFGSNNRVVEYDDRRQAVQSDGSVG